MAGGAARQFFLNLPAGSPPLRATLDDDALEIDNQVLLLPESTKPLRVLVDLADASLRQAVVAGLGGHRADGRGFRAARADHLATSPAPIGRRRLAMEILGGKDAVAYAGPFVIDHNHPLAQGLSLQNAIWSASSETQPGGSADRHGRQRAADDRPRATLPGGTACR